MENPDYRYVIWDEARMQQEEQRKLQDTALEHRTLLEALQNVSETELAQLKETFSMGICMERRRRTQAESVGVRIKAIGQWKNE